MKEEQILEHGQHSHHILISKVCDGWGFNKLNAHSQIYEQMYSIRTRGDSLAKIGK